MQTVSAMCSGNLERRNLQRKKQPWQQILRETQPKTKIILAQSPPKRMIEKPKKAVSKSARAKTKIDCAKIRCRVALVTGNKVGTVTAGEQNKSCQWCKNFDKELAALEEIESMLLGNAHNLKLYRIITSPHQTKTKEDLRTLLKEDLGIREPPKKVYSKLANTPLLIKHPRSLHTDIDQLFKGTQREGIRLQSYTTCLCKINEAAQPSIPTHSTPSHTCQVCTHQRELIQDTHNDNECATCGKDKNTSNLHNDTSVCHTSPNGSSHKIAQQKDISGSKTK